MKRIIVDMFGADGGPEVIVRGAVRALAAQKEYDIVLAGSSLIAQIVLQEEASRMGIVPSELSQRLSVIETNSFVTNTEDPRNMVRDRNDTSMVLALQALRDNEEIRAMVTAGSTGCALVGSCFHLGLEKGLLQPALASALPKRNGGFSVLADCGSNLQPKPKELEQYARLGAALVKESYGVEEPAVGLLNVGREAGKGTEIQQEAYEKIKEAAKTRGFRFAGNIEGGDILKGDVDVVVCDGFTGNVVLKGLEQAGLIAAELAKEETTRSEKTDLSLRQIEDPYNRDPEAPGLSGSERIRRFFDYNSQAGAIFLGTKKLLLKAHGAATEDTICSCILQAVNLLRGTLKGQNPLPPPL